LSPTVAEMAGTPANRCGEVNTREMSVTLAPLGQPARTDPNTRTLIPRRTLAGKTATNGERFTRSMPWPKLPPPQRARTEYRPAPRVIGIRVVAENRWLVPTRAKIAGTPAKL
jgi:hypothetical protein